MVVCGSRPQPIGLPLGFRLDAINPLAFYGYPKSQGLTQPSLCNRTAPANFSGLIPQPPFRPFDSRDRPIANGITTRSFSTSRADPPSATSSVFSTPKPFTSIVQQPLTALPASRTLESFALHIGPVSPVDFYRGLSRAPGSLEIQACGDLGFPLIGRLRARKRKR
jgi:hypothetical protein